MEEQHTPDVPAQWTDMARQMRALAAQSTEIETAEGLREVIHELYDMTKFDRPGGEGLDGKDGPERRGIGYILDMAEDYYVRTRDARRL
ncbi:hypothetical protein ACWEOD_10130 [Micrococcus luteus]